MRGVSTVSVSDGKHTVMTDGFFSRPDFFHLVLGVSPNESRINKALAAGKITSLDALLVAHSHHDHAMDVGVVAMKTGAIVIGTRSVANIALGSGLPASRTKTVLGGETIELGQFKVHVISSPHSANPVFPGEITSPLDTPSGIGKYKEGGNFSYLIEHPKGRVLVHASANYRPGMYAGMRADVVFLGVGLLGKQSDAFIRDYWREVVQTTGAKIVVPVHWDDFTVSLDRPLKPTGRLFDKVDEALAAVGKLATADGVEVRMLSQFQAVQIPAPQ
ncbi:MBL fold metallo-hydrolase [Aquabacterium sp.]|uniref:MBL fold metallo-hydrolase n=1 Tax=Aquabacterium sp. TaxID=1872578 RepID=UPI002E350C57|nr:MBL fold metallo-hydrolase [Aquabacterium sp.]HEX5310799.1 MBL fold metallo-hydrolase [Aquabacterium sp.]